MRKYYPKRSTPLLLLAAALMASAGLKAQNYDQHAAFAPFFYSQNGNSFRSANGDPGANYWQNKADYKIDASFDSSSHLLKGVVKIHYTNNSPEDLPYLWLELDQNTEKPEALANTLNSSNRTLSDKMGFKFAKVQVEVAGHLVNARYEIKDTRMQLWLPKDVKAGGGSVNIQMDYSFELQASSAGDRAGFMPTAEGTIFEFGYWFPRLSVYDDLRGWNTLPFIGGGEFYFEYGDIDYRITAPSSMLAIGAGALMNAKEALAPSLYSKLQQAKQSDKTVVIRSASDVKNGIATAKKSGTTTWHFEMKNTRDVAFALSTAFIWDGAKINLPEQKSSFAQSVYPISSTQGKDSWKRATEFLKASVEDFSNRWFTYPYPEATNVAGPIGGMEYPGFTFDHHSARGKDLFMLLSHEIGHTWFPMIVGSDERRLPFMDEGFNTFIDIYAQQDFNKGEFAPKRDGEYAPHGGNPADEIVPVIKDVQGGPTLMTPADWQDYKYVHPMSYFKTAFGLVLLREVILGPERFDDAFKHYTQKWAYKHPTAVDFFRSIENTAGEDLGWFWRGWFLNNWQLDQAVSKVNYVDGDPTKGALITIQNKQQLPMPVSIKVTPLKGEPIDIKLPVEIWQRGDTWTFRAHTNAALKSVLLDPQAVLPDMDRSNNEWKP